MKQLDCVWDELSGTCGLEVLFEFSEFDDNDEEDYSWNKPFDIEQCGRRGTGFKIAGFIDNEDCQAAYKIFKRKCQIVYQSPVRINKNTGNEFFFIVMDVRKEKPSNRKYKWPTPFEVEK